MISVALTGNIGAGKSTVAGLFAELGAEVVDADEIVHELLGDGGAAVAPVLSVFPEVAGGGDRWVDRKALAGVVFTDPQRRRELERILHPLVVAMSDQRLRQAAHRGRELAVTEAAMLFEAARAGTAPDPRKRFAAIIAVTCDPTVVLARRSARSAGVEPDFHRRWAAQMPQDEKAALADHVIDNSGPLAETAGQVRVIRSKLMEARDAREQATPSR